jgi:hypothetical protein
MNCVPSVLLPFACLAKRASTKTGNMKKRNYYTIKVKNTVRREFFALPLL